MGWSKVPEVGRSGFEILTNLPALLGSYLVAVTSRLVCKIGDGVQTPILIQVMEHGKDYPL